MFIKTHINYNIGPAHFFVFFSFPIRVACMNWQTPYMTYLPFLLVAHVVNSFFLSPSNPTRENNDLKQKEEQTGVPFLYFLATFLSVFYLFLISEQSNKMTSSPTWSNLTSQTSPRRSSRASRRRTTCCWIASEVCTSPRRMSRWGQVHVCLYWPRFDIQERSDVCSVRYLCLIWSNFAFK